MKKSLIVLLVLGFFISWQKEAGAVAVTGTCGWCGATCERMTMGQACLDVLPPAGKTCLEEGGVCVVKDEVKVSPTMARTASGEAFLYLKSVNTVDETTQNYDLVDLGMEANTTVGGVDIWLTFNPEIWQLMKVETLSGTNDKFSFTNGGTRIDNKKGTVDIALLGRGMGVSLAEINTTFKQSLLRLSFKPLKAGTQSLNFVCQNGSSADTNIFDKNVNDIVNCSKNVSLGGRRVILPVGTVVPELTPATTVAPTMGSGIFYATSSVILKADDFVIKANGKEFRPKGQVVSVHSDPPEIGENQRTTLELMWNDSGVEMRTYLYFSYVKSTNIWTLDETRTYNGKIPGDWLFYHSRTPISMNMHQQPYKNTLELKSDDGLGRITIKNMELSLNFVLSNGCVTSKGDANGDGKVDLVDFGIWKVNYLVSIKPVESKADFNCDSRVDLVDFGIWKKAYLKN